MKLLFENWRRYLKEEKEEHFITPAQNRALKKLYVHVSRFVIAVQRALEENPGELAVLRLIRSGYIDLQKYGFRRKGNQYFLLDLNLLDEIPVENLKLTISAVGAPGASVVVDDEGVARMRLSGLLAADMFALKSFIQHELHHLFTQEHLDAAGHAGARDTEIKKINYIFDEGELRAHTKQYAYLYHKLFPEEEKFNSDKFIDEISNRKIGIGRGPIFLYRKELLMPHAKELGGRESIEKMNNKATKYTQYFLSLFKGDI